jgi:hypothetical protein
MNAQPLHLLADGTLAQQVQAAQLSWMNHANLVANNTMQQQLLALLLGCHNLHSSICNHNLTDTHASAFEGVQVYTPLLQNRFLVIAGLCLVLFH